MDRDQLNSNKFNPARLIYLFIILLVLVVLGWPAYHFAHRSSYSKYRDGWAEYSSKSYPFAFQYPESWGPPAIHNLPLDQGKHYSIVFPGKASLSLVSSDAKEPTGCKDDCNPVLTKAYIQNILSSKNAFLKKGSDNYALLIVPSSEKQELIIDSYVNLTGIKIDAAELTLIKNSSNCSKVKLTQEYSQKCFSENDYDSGMKILRSFKT